MFGEIKAKSEIIKISKKYKNIFIDLIDSLDKEFLNWLRSIDKWLYNTPRLEIV